MLILANCTSPASRVPPLSKKQDEFAKGRGGYKVGNPYQIDGVWYYPKEDLNYEETGIASWYGEQFHAKDTANGEVFDLNTLTAAHRTLPLPSIVEVTNLENGRVLQLRVNDRGPFARGRIIDVSRRGAQLLGFEGQGTAKVRVRILAPESIQVAALARRIGGEPIPIEQAKAAPRGRVVAEALPVMSGTAPTQIAAVPSPTAAPRGGRAPAPPAAQLAAAGDEPKLPEQVSVVVVKPTQIYVQAGSFSRQDNADRVRQKLDPIGPVKMTGARVSGVQFYRVRVGPLPTVDEADSVLARVVAAGIPEARIVVD